MNSEQAEAGPSTPRTPPDTPSTKSRRRSWFGLVTSPFASTAATANPSNSPRRKSFADDEEGHELAERSFKSSLIDAPLSSTEHSGSRRSEGKASEMEQGEEILTIDGQVETLSSGRSRRKKKWRSAGLDEEQGETVRLEDLSLRRGSSRSTLRPAQDAARVSIDGGHPNDEKMNGHTSLKDNGMPEPEPEPPGPILDIPQLEPALPTPQRRIVPSPRSSSLALPTIRVPPDKSTPPIPTDRPLPALPPISLIPTDIVITPSSPRKLQKPSRRTSTLMTDLRGRVSIQEPVSDSRNSSRSRKVISRKSSLIGLGLPNSIRSDGDEPPPLPQKSQSVSSPHPSRSNSPVPIVSFAEPEEGKERGRPGTTKTGQGKEVKRARSLSGIFNRSASQPVTSKTGSATGSHRGTPTHQDEVEVLEMPDQGGSETGKIAGVLEWLGVRKSGKRRLSDVKAAVERDKVRNEVEAGMSDKEKAGTAMTMDIADTPRNGTLRPDDLRRPHLRDLSSTATIKPDDQRRRSSSATRSRTFEDRSGSGLIAIATNRSAFSSKASLSQPVNDPSTPPSGIPEPFVTSPTSESGVMLFDPPSAPWLDAIEQLPIKDTNAVVAASETVSSQIVPQSGRDGRLRSWSDAPTRSPALVQPENRGPSDSSDRLPAPVAPVPALSNRPRLGNRSHSGNSAIIEKMKGVFAKSSSSRNRARSKSLLPDQAGEAGVSEFGGIPTGRSRAGTASTASVASFQWSPSMAPNASLLDLHHGVMNKISLDEASTKSPRPSFSGTARSTPPSSYQPVSESPVEHSQPNTAIAPRPIAQARNRGRASTVSFASSAPQTSFIPPPSPNFFPVAATPPRRRPSAIQRFSSGLLGSSAPSSPKGSLFPLPPRSSGSTFSSAAGTTGGVDDVDPTGTLAPSQIMTPGTGPRPSTGPIVPKHDALRVSTVPEESESEEDWLERMMITVGRADIAGILASSGDAFHTRALELYMESFDFTHQALDVALRILLLEMSLPKETQQIDRVVEAFAKRYEACEPGLFGSKDNTYVLAFSMMMLHTDAFNRNNKNKMSKSDYVRNTRMDGVSPIILEAFYDNITYTPFVHLDDNQGESSEILSPTQTMRSSGSRSRSGSDAVYPTPPSTSSSVLSTPVTPISALPSTALTTPRTASSAAKPDIYALMANNLLPTLRVDVEQHIPARSPFSCLGTRSVLEFDRLQQAFVTAGIMLIGGDSPSKKRPAPARRGMVSEGEEGEVSLRVTKVGLLSRKDDAAGSSARRTSRKWRSWSVILTGSQLLFFKDPMWALTLQQQLEAEGTKRDDRSQILLPRVAKFVPDEVFPLKDAVAVLDSKMVGQPNTFRFHLAHRAYLIQASDETEMNDWINLINYAAAFKSSGIRMRAGHIRRDQAFLAGAAAASSLKREVKSIQAMGENGTHSKKTFGSAAEAPTLPIVIDSTLSESQTSASGRRSTDSRQSDISLSPVSGKNALSSVESAESIGKDDGEQLGDVFDAVKAELVAGGGAAGGIIVQAKRSCSRPESSGRNSVKSGLRIRIPSAQAVRTKAIETSILDLKKKLDSAQVRLDSHLTQARNLAVLTPFQRTTRDRISSAIPQLTNHIRTERLLIAKLDIWILILQADLEREERDWAVTRHVALQAAERSLNTPGGVRAVMEAVQEGEREGKEVIVPSLSLPAGVSAEEEGRNDQDDQEVLQEEEEAGTKEEEGSGTDSLGTTPHELPILIRHTSDEALGIVPKVARPGFKRHVSASSLSTRDVRDSPDHRA